MSRFITEHREQRFKKVIAKRQLNLTVILENVHDPHNIGAVLRSCDAVGLHEVYIIYTERRLQDRGVIGHNSSSGSLKWVQLRYFENVKKCMDLVKSKYDKIYATHLNGDSKDLYELDFTESTALLFGNEHDGVSTESLSYCDGNFTIPQHGMVQSLNISVACAVTLFEAQRQRKLKGAYGHQFDHSNSNHVEMFELYCEQQLKAKSKE